MIWPVSRKQLWSFWQLPNQQLQQRTLHQINTLLSEWRFEQEELNARIEDLEGELAEIKSLLKTNTTKTASKSKPAATKTRKTASKGDASNADNA